MAKITNKEAKELQAIKAYLESIGLDYSKLSKGIKGNAPKPAPEKVDIALGEFKTKEGHSIEFRKWSDKEGRLFVAQTKVLSNGTRTKGFGIPVEEFKAYVSKLNSIADKLGA